MRRRLYNTCPGRPINQEERLLASAAEISGIGSTGLPVRLEQCERNRNGLGHRSRTSDKSWREARSRIEKPTFWHLFARSHGLAGGAVQTLSMEARLLLLSPALGVTDEGAPPRLPEAVALRWS